MNCIIVKQLCKKLNAERQGSIGINAVYDLVKYKDFPLVRRSKIGNKSKRYYKFYLEDASRVTFFA